MRTLALAVASMVMTAVILAAQSPGDGELAFEVVSIRENATTSSSGGGGPRPGGRFIYTNVRAIGLISSAYAIPSDRVVGAPAWAGTLKYDINAIGKENANIDEIRQMLLSMLRDRFSLAAHIERRELPVYHLVLARSDGRLGPKVRPSAVDCENPETARKAAKTAASTGGRIPCGISFLPNAYVIGGERIAILEPLLSTAAGRPVLDRTGLTGRYDIDLEWSRAGAEQPDGVSIFTAVQEQLGLKLESTTALLDVVVIDRFERPSEN